MCQENFRVSPVHILYYGLIADGRREPPLIRWWEDTCMDSVNKDEVKVGFSWIIKMFGCYFVFMAVKDFIQEPSSGWILLGYTIVFLFVLFGSLKCTSSGVYVGLNFYFCCIYRNKCVKYEKWPDLSIFGGFWTYMISFTGYTHGSFPRNMISNFDAWAELISRNTHIKSRNRQQFIDYVNVRKQQSKISKMLPTIIVITVFFIIIKYF
jgi:hypothetical protein